LVRRVGQHGAAGVCIGAALDSEAALKGHPEIVKPLE